MNFLKLKQLLSFYQNYIYYFQNQNYIIFYKLYILLAFSSEVQSHVMEGHVEMEHMICHGSTEVQDVMCQQQSGDPGHDGIRGALG